MPVTEVILFFFPLLIFICINCVFLSKNPVYGVLSFIGVVLNIVILLILLDQEFLAYILAIVYIGAIVVLFVFVIMMFTIRNYENKRIWLIQCGELYLLGVFSASFLTLFMDWNFYMNTIDVFLAEKYVVLLGTSLFNEYSILSILAALIMFVGIVGAIILTLKTQNVSRMTILSRAYVKDSIDKVEI